jgi:hypothetical protein
MVEKEFQEAMRNNKKSEPIKYLLLLIPAFSDFLTSTL